MSNITKAQIITNVTDRVGSAVMLDWTPDVVRSSDFDRDALTNRVHAVAETETNVSGFLMVARALTIWGANFHGLVGEGQAYADLQHLAIALGSSKGYASKGLRFGRAYVEYGVTPGTDLWSRITAYDLPATVRKDLGQSPEEGADLAAIRERWEVEIAAHLAAKQNPVPPADSESGEGEGGESGEVTHPLEDVDALAKQIRAMARTLRDNGDRESLESLAKTVQDLLTYVTEIGQDVPDVAEAV